jgi:hypothetical protein
MPRRASLFVFLGLAIALVFVTGISAGAESDGSIRSKKADVGAVQDRLVEIRLEASSAEAAYNNALYEMNQLNGQITGRRQTSGRPKSDSLWPKRLWKIGPRKFTRVGT